MHVTNPFDLSAQFWFVIDVYIGSVLPHSYFSLSVCFVSPQCQYSVTRAGSLGPQVLSPQSTQPENPPEATGTCTFFYITSTTVQGDN